MENQQERNRREAGSRANEMLVWVQKVLASYYQESRHATKCSMNFGFGNGRRKLVISTRTVCIDDDGTTTLT
jgi:hypothetical protein